MYLRTVEGPGHQGRPMDVNPVVSLSGHSSLGSVRSDEPGFTLWLAFHARGFWVTDEFLEQWIKFSKTGRWGTTEEFRKAFCQADHSEFEWRSKDKPNATPLKFNAAEVWGYTIVYSYRRGHKPYLVGIQKKDWHLQFVGRSIPDPKFPLCKRAFAKSHLGDLMMNELLELLSEKTGMSKEALERLIRGKMSKEEVERLMKE